MHWAHIQQCFWTCLFEWHCQMESFCFEWKALETAKWPNLFPFAQFESKAKNNNQRTRPNWLSFEKFNGTGNEARSILSHEISVRLFWTILWYQLRSVDWVAHKLFALGGQIQCRIARSTAVAGVFDVFHFSSPLPSSTKSPLPYASTHIHAYTPSQAHTMCLCCRHYDFTLMGIVFYAR